MSTDAKRKTCTMHVYQGTRRSQVADLLNKWHQFSQKGKPAYLCTCNTGSKPPPENTRQTSSPLLECR
eukprot:101372-Pelagomonas_calceolata.AAC.2